MKTKITHIALFALLTVSQIFAQDVTTVRANSGDISDNLDLKAVASIFGDSRDLEDFERRLNDPDIQISNLDLNGDNRVDYLRVIEATENNTHLIIVQAVLGADTFQDVATIEVERDRSNNVQVQVVGDVYMYGPNYIYEPVYVSRPFIFDVFWLSSYRPYYSPWYWGYYPTYYSYWAPCNYYRYRNHVRPYINVRNTYNYVNTRRSSRAIALYNTRRANAYERQHPGTSFSSRNSNAGNRYALEQNRSNSRSAGKATRSTLNNTTRATTNNVKSTNINTVRSNGSLRSDNLVRKNTDAVTSRNTTPSVRNATAPARSSSTTVRSNAATSRSEAQQPARQTRTVERTAPATARSTPAPSRNSGISSPVRSAPSARSTPSAAPSRSAAPVRSSGGGSRSGGGGHSRG
jgi:hypothetical protein